MIKIKKIFEKNKENIKRIISVFVTICSVVTAVASVIIAKQALDISEITLKSSSQNSEPILDMDIDWQTDTLHIKNLSSNIYKIYHVNFGLIKTIAIVDADLKINGVELEDMLTSMNLEHGHTTGTDCSDEDAERYNKEFVLRLSDTSESDFGVIVDNRSETDKIEKSVRNLCELSEEYNYWNVSPNFDYRFIEIYYEDLYGNREAQYYIYKYEYSSSWKKYKLNEEEYIDYVSGVMTKFTEESIVQVLSDKNRFYDMEDTKYNNFWFYNEQKYMKEE